MDCFKYKRPIYSPEMRSILSICQHIGYAEKWEDIMDPYLFLQAYCLDKESEECEIDGIHKETLALYGRQVLDWCLTKRLIRRFSKIDKDTPWLISALDQEKEFNEVKSVVLNPNYIAPRASFLGYPDDAATITKEFEAVIGACAIDSALKEDLRENPESLPDLTDVDYGKIEKIITNVLNRDSFLDFDECKISIRKDSIIQEADINYDCKGGLSKLYTKGIIAKPVYQVEKEIQDIYEKRMVKCSCSVPGYEKQTQDGYCYTETDAEECASTKRLLQILKRHPGI